MWTYLILAASVLFLVASLMLYLRSKRIERQHRKTESVVPPSRPGSSGVADYGDEVIWELARGALPPSGDPNERRRLGRRYVLLGGMAGLGAILAARAAAIGLSLPGIEKWIERLANRGLPNPSASNRDSRRYEAASGHRDAPARDHHTDAPSRHVDVTEPCDNPPCPHADFERPHIDSHFDSPHGDETTPPPPPGNEHADSLA